MLSLTNSTAAVVPPPTVPPPPFYYDGLHFYCLVIHSIQDTYGLTEAGRLSDLKYVLLSTQLHASTFTTGVLNTRGWG